MVVCTFRHMGRSKPPGRVISKRCLLGEYQQFGTERQAATSIWAHATRTIRGGSDNRSTTLGSIAGWFDCDGAVPPSFPHCLVPLGELGEPFLA